MAIRAFIAQSACNEVITGDCYARRPVSRPVFIQPMFCRGVLPILLLMDVLGGNELRLQGDHPRIARCHDHRGDDSMGIGGGVVFVLHGAALVTVGFR